MGCKTNRFTAPHFTLQICTTNSSLQVRMTTQSDRTPLSSQLWHFCVKIHTCIEPCPRRCQTSTVNVCGWSRLKETPPSSLYLPSRVIHDINFKFFIEGMLRERFLIRDKSKRSIVASKIHENISKVRTVKLNPSALGAHQARHWPLTLPSSPQLSDWTLWVRALLTVELSFRPGFRLIMCGVVNW